MCVISNVMDYYKPLFPAPVDGLDVLRASPTDWTKILQPLIDMEELRKLIADFKEAVAAARKLDALMKTPDCADPEKVKLEERVAELEKRLAEIDDWRGRK
jgi:hypothetical protein